MAAGLLLGLFVSDSEDEEQQSQNIMIERALRLYNDTLNWCISTDRTIILI